MPQPVDLARPLPDEAHEGLRLAVVQAIADLGDSFMLADTLFGLVDQTLADISTGTTQRGQLQQRVTALEAQVADLITRVAALEQPLP